MGLLLFFGFTVSYPDIITGRVVINSSIAPIKLVAGSSGKIHLNGIISSSKVKEGEVIAWIENATSYKALKQIDSVLSHYDSARRVNVNILQRLPSKASLGELTTVYNNFLSSVQQLQNFYTSGKYNKQIARLYRLQEKQRKEIQNNRTKLSVSARSVEIVHGFYSRDSLLHTEKVVADAELDKTRLDYLNSKNAYTNTVLALIQAQKEARQTASRIGELRITNEAEQKELKLSVRSSLNILKDNIRAWKERYIFTAPFAGKVQFLKFWTTNQFIQSGEEVFTVIPPKQESYGQVTIASAGAGKVKKGQTVVIKLDDYPYLEFGSINGVVKDISLTTNTEKTQQGNIDTYLVTVKFDKGIITNYGNRLDITQEAKGRAEIVVNERRLINRFFDNLKYVWNK